jgi:HK97 family phage portal protein
VSQLQEIVIRPRRSWLERMGDQLRSFTLGPYSAKDPALARLFGGGSVSAGVSVSEDSALDYSPVWAAVNLISSDVASLPLILYKRDPNGGKQRYSDAKLYRLLHDEPNPEMTSFSFREALQAHMLIWGNAYAEIERDAAGSPVALWPIAPHRVEPFRPTVTVNGRDRLGPLHYRIDGQHGITLAASDMLHIPGLSPDGSVGYRFVAKARESIGLGVAMERFGGTYYGNGSTFGGILMHPRTLSKQAEENLRSSIEARHKGPDRAHRFLILQEDMKFEPNGVPPNAAQFIESRKFQVTEVARWFRVPPHKISDLERATFSNIEQQELDYVIGTLRPWLVRWEQEINRKLIPRLERRQQFAEHLVDGRLRGDIQSRYTALGIARDKGIISADEWREIENWNPQPGGQGKQYLVQQAMIPADQLGALIQSQITKNETPKTVTPPTDREQFVKDLEQRCEAMEEQAAIAWTRKSEAEAALAVATDDVDVVRMKYEAEKALLDSTRQELTTAQSLLLLAQEAAERERRDKEAATEERDGFKLAAEGAIAELHGAESTLATLRTELSELATRAGTAAAERDAATAQVMDAIAERDVAVDELTELQSVVPALGANVALRDARIAELEQEIATKTQTVVDAIEREARLETTYVETREKAAQAEALLIERRQAEVAKLTSMIAVHRGLFVHAMERMIRRETENARRRQATPQKLRTWLEAFYVTHEEHCTDALVPAIAAHLAWRGSSDAPLDVAGRYAREHVEESTRQLRAILDGTDPDEFHVELERTLRRWEQDRPNVIADRILREEVEHVRSIQ